MRRSLIAATTALMTVGSAAAQEASPTHDEEILKALRALSGKVEQLQKDTSGIKDGVDTTNEKLEEVGKAIGEIPESRRAVFIATSGSPLNSCTQGIAPSNCDVAKGFCQGMWFDDGRAIRVEGTTQHSAFGDSKVTMLKEVVCFDR